MPYENYRRRGALALEILHSNCSDYLYIYTAEAYARRDELSILRYSWEELERMGELVMGYVNPYEQLDVIIKWVRDNGAVIVEFEPLNWPFNPERPDEPLRLPREREAALEAIGFPPLYVARDMLRDALRRVREGIRLLQDHPRPRFVYEAYHALYSAARRSTVEGAGLVTTIAGVVTTAEGMAALIAKKRGRVCVERFPFKTSKHLLTETRTRAVDFLARC